MDKWSAAAALALGAFALAGSIADIRWRILPNWLCFAAFLVGGAVSYGSGGIGTAASSVLHALIALLVGMALYAWRAIGGGDAKFYAGLAAWFPLAKGFLYLSAVAISGLVLLTVWFVARRKRRAGRLGTSTDDAFGKLPYGVAIGTGAVIAYVVGEVVSHGKL